MHRRDRRRHRPPAGWRKRTELRAWLQNTLLPRFGDRVLRFDTRVALIWGQLVADTAKHPLALRDSFIAATALRHNLAMVTRNTADFQAPGLRVINPWS